MKIFLLAGNENWVCDRFVDEWKRSFPNLACENPDDADILWLLAGWCWKNINPNLLLSKRVIITVHHIVPEKFLQKQKEEFLLRDQFVDSYHVPCEKSYEQIRGFTKKPICVIPFWVNQSLWKDIPEKSFLRSKFGIKEDSFLVGSFQRDTEGHDLISPKLEKGPDLFCDAVEEIFHLKKKDDILVEVLLAGWRRQYIMNRLSQKGIGFYYSELPSFETLNELYNTLDLYIVAARYEGGPQAIVECATNKTPIISTDVGLAASILDQGSIFSPGNATRAIASIDTAYRNVKDMWIPCGFNSFIEFFSNTHE